MKELIKSIAKLFNFNYAITLNKTRFKIPVVNNLGAGNIRLKEDWIFSLLKMLELKNDEQFIDVGVNFGQTLLAYRSCYPNNTYYGFEPNPPCLFYLRRLIEKNRFNNVNIIPVGLSDSTGLVKFFSQTVYDSSATIIEDLRPDFYTNTLATYIPVFKFDELVVANNEKVAVVKIDVEGAELNVLKGMKNLLNKQKPIVICEILDYHTQSTAEITQQRATALVNMMKENGYSVYKIKVAGNKVSFNKIDKITLTQWTTKSMNANDYLFIQPDSARMLAIEKNIE